MIVPGYLAPQHLRLAPSIPNALHPTIVWPTRLSRLADEEEGFPEARSVAPTRRQGLPEPLPKKIGRPSRATRNGITALPPQ